MGVGPVGFDVEQQALIWAMWRRGDAIREMERTLGETLPRIRRYLRESGGMPPVPRRRRAGHLSLGEREEISRGVAAGLSARMIAGRIDRPSSTVSREIARNGGRDAYRALVADGRVDPRSDQHSGPWWRWYRGTGSQGARPGYGGGAVFRPGPPQRRGRRFAPGSRGRARWWPTEAEFWLCPDIAG
jgi:hypothetical protein